MTYLSNFIDRTYRVPLGAQCGYRYTSINFVVLHVSSVPQEDEAAIEYVAQVNKWYPTTKVMLIEKRNKGQQDWRLIHRVEEELLGLLPIPGLGADTESEEDEQAAPQAAVISVPPVIRPVEYDPEYAAECAAANARIKRVLGVRPVILKPFP